MRLERHPCVLGYRREARPDATDDLGLLLDRVHVGRASLGAVAEEQLRRRAHEAHHHHADADIGDRVVGMLHVDAQVRLHSVIEQGPGARPPELVGYHRRDDDIAAQADAGADDRLDGADRGNAAALVVMRAHSPDPAVLELGPEGIHSPPRHLGAWIHVSVEQKGGPSSAAAQTPDRLPALLRRILRMQDLHHFDLEADVRHRVGVEVRDFSLLERRAGDSDRALLEIEDPPLIHGGNGRCGINAGSHMRSPDSVVSNR